MNADEAERAGVAADAAAFVGRMDGLLRDLGLVAAMIGNANEFHQRAFDHAERYEQDAPAGERICADALDRAWGPICDTELALNAIKVDTCARAVSVHRAVLDSVAYQTPIKLPYLADLYEHGSRREVLATAIHLPVPALDERWTDHMRSISLQSLTSAGEYLTTAFVRLDKSWRAAPALSIEELDQNIDGADWETRHESVEALTKPLGAYREALRLTVARCNYRPHDGGASV